MARKVFFSFHYDDVASFRANVVRNHGFFKGNEPAGFWDESIWEEVARDSELALKRLINGALQNTSVTCVLIGSETYRRPWVRYEIFKSIERNNGIFGVHINGIRDKDGERKPLGKNPFQYLSLHSTTILSGSRLHAEEWNGNRFVPFDKLPELDYEGFRRFNGSLSQYFPVYDWIGDFGYTSFAQWVEKAAQDAGRR